MSESDKNWILSEGIISFKDIFSAIYNRGGNIPSIKAYNANADALCTFNFSSPNEYKITIEAKDEDRRSIIDSLRMTGLLDLVYTYSESQKPFATEPTRKRTLSSDFQKWFQGITKGRTLVPDTNSILNHTFSSLALVFGDDILKDIHVLIPRLVILEMERQANSKPNIDCNNPKSEKECLHCRKKRWVMLGYQEIMFLKNMQAGMFPDLDAEILARFTQISAELTADSWIRKEIKDYAKNVIKRKTEIGGSRLAGDIPKFLMVSSDFVNSLSAVAENIDSIYITKMIDSPTRMANLKHIAKFLIYLSVLEEQIQVDIGSTQYEIKGFWQGKTTFDLLNNRIMMRNPPLPHTRSN